MEPVIAKGKTEFFNKLKMQLDMGSNTADAVRQPDGSWEVDGQGTRQDRAPIALRHPTVSRRMVRTVQSSQALERR